MRILLSTLSLFLIGIFNSLIAQLDKFIEVAVHESVENPVENVSIYLNVKSAQYQYYYLMDEEEYYYDEGIYEEYPDTYIDESLSSKEKKKREQEIEKALEEWDRRIEEHERAMEEEREKRMAEREVFTSGMAEAILIQNGYAISIVNEPFPNYMYEEDGGSDTVFVIEIKDAESYTRLRDLFDENVVSIAVKEYEYKKNADALEEVFPKLMASAEKQAKVIASASGKKIGTVAQITNVYPGFSPTLMERQMDEAKRLGNYRRYDGDMDNPFLKKERLLFEYVFRFPILN